MRRLMEVAEAKSTKTGSRIDFQTEGGGDWPAWDRFITLDGKRAHHIGNICGTCPFIFERREGANDKISPTELSNTLRNGISSIDETVTDAAMEILPAGAYKALINETLSLTESDVDLQNNLVTLHRDGALGKRTIPIGPSLHDSSSL